MQKYHLVGSFDDDRSFEEKCLCCAARSLIQNSVTSNKLDLPSPGTKKKSYHTLLAVFRIGGLWTNGSFPAVQTTIILGFPRFIFGSKASLLV